MKSEGSIEIEAPITVVWDVFSDVERWPSWTASVTRVVALGDPDLAPGNRFEIAQPRFPKLVWEVTEVVPGRSWTWRQRSLGSLTFAAHALEAIDEHRTRVRQTIDQRGPVGLLVGRLTARLTRRYLGMEAEGLKSASEQRHHGAARA